jgi:hypothetical protein
MAGGLLNRQEGGSRVNCQNPGKSLQGPQESTRIPSGTTLFVDEKFRGPYDVLARTKTA